MSETQSLHVLEPGQELTLVAHLDGNPHSELVSVLTGDPLVIEAPAGWCRHLRRSAKIVLLRPLAGHFVKCEVPIQAITKFRNSFRFELGEPSWQATDRRRFPRFDVDVPMMLRRITEVDGNIQMRAETGRSVEMSVGGAWVLAGEAIEAGTILQVEMRLGEQPCRMLAVVVRNESDREGFAVEYLDYVGGARRSISDFLSGLA
jgi:hypothetical protein